MDEYKIAYPFASFDGRAVAAEFIEKRLPDYHPVFRGKSSRNETMPNINSHPSKPASNPVAGTPPPVKAKMEYWNKIFPAAMADFKANPDIKAPKNRESMYEIRSEVTWDAIYGKLGNARDHYTSKGGVIGTVRWAWRWIADNATEPLGVTVKLTPSIDIVTPVLGAVSILLKAAKKAAEARSKVLEGFDGIEDLYSDVEILLNSSNEDDRLRMKAITLVANILVAVERVITFFISSEFSRTKKAIFRGDNYGKDVLESLETVTNDGRKFIAEGSIYHVKAFSIFSKEAITILEAIQDGQGISDITIDFVSSKLEEVDDKLGVVQNTLHHFKVQHDQILQTLMDKNEQEKRIMWDFICHQDRLRSVSPAYQSPWGIPLLPPSLSAAAPSKTLEPYIDQDRLWQLLSIADIDTADIDLVLSKEQLLAPKDVAHAQQIVRDTHGLFEAWLVSPASTRLLIHGNFSGLMLQISALSTFCGTLAKAFRARKSYLCLVWFCGRHLGTGLSDAGDSDSGVNDDDSASSCGSEDGYGDFYQDGTRLGPLKRMLRSLIAQLLCDYDFGARNLLPASSGIDPELIGEGSLLQLRCLLGWLVRRLPGEITLFVLLDGVGFYERDPFVDPLLDVLGDVLGLVNDKSIMASVKVLLTSPWPTKVVRAAFEQDGEGDQGKTEESLILAMDSLPPISWPDTSNQRLRRELAGMEEVSNASLDNSDFSDN